MLEETTRPPTPLAAEILSMILRPLDTCSDAGPDVSSRIMIQLCQHFLARPLTDQVGEGEKLNNKLLVRKKAINLQINKKEFSVLENLFGKKSQLILDILKEILDSTRACKSIIPS